jgi:hypothetical protein
LRITGSESSEAGVGTGPGGNGGGVLTLHLQQQFWGGGGQTIRSEGSNPWCTALPAGHA